MAISTARVQLGGQWYDLTLDPATRQWTAKITAPGSSVHQPGGVYNLTVEATNEASNTVTADGTTVPGLRLTVRERVKPVITLVSPLAKHEEDILPIVLDVTDDDSGVNIETFILTVDGVSAPVEYFPVEGGYRVTCTPERRYSAIHAEVTDYDGNTGVFDGSFPALELFTGHFIVDWDGIEMSGRAGFPATVSIENGGVPAGAQDVGEDGRYNIDVPLDVGDNYLTVSATRAGLTTVRDVYVIRLVTDRTQADVDRLKALCKVDMDDWNTDEYAWFWDTVCRGAYNAEDLNRVNRAMAYLNDRYRARGYAPKYAAQIIHHKVPIFSDKPDEDGEYPAIGWNEWDDGVWIEHDIPAQDQMDAYLANVDAFQHLVPLADPPDTPEDMDGFTFGEANDIESILVKADAVIPNIELSAWYSGEIFAGEF